MRKKLHPIYNDETKIEKGVKEIETRLMTNSWDKYMEKHLMSQIE